MHTTTFFKTNDIDKLVLLLQNILHTSNDALCVCDQYGHVLIYNEAYHRLTNVPIELLNKHSTFELVDMNILPNSSATVALRTKKTYSSIINYHNGIKAIVTATPFFDQNNQILFVVSNVRDVTELNRLKVELEESRQMNSVFKKALVHVNLNLNKDQSLLYKSKEMQEVMLLASRFSNNDSPVLLLGESGVGKDVLAHFIHEESKRNGQFIKINCGAIPSHLLESELFGYEKGAFTGASHSKEGLFELANKGTIFLDEIADLPYSLQVKLLNVLQDYKIRRLGGKVVHDIDVRIITATNGDLKRLVKQKKFRLDLYYRLNVLPISIPPLRERKEDIPVLLYHNLDKLEHKYKMKKRLDHDALDRLLSYQWPGNIRELNNTVERLYHLTEGEKIMTDHLPSVLQDDHDDGDEIERYHEQEIVELKQAVANFERKYISDILSRTSTLQECANRLGINISTLVRKKRSLHLK